MVNIEKNANYAPKFKYSKLKIYFKMKKIVFILFFSLVAKSASAQFWMEAGIKGATGATLLYNKNILDDGDASYKIKSDFAVGPRVAFNFGDHHGVSVEGLFSQSKAYYAGQNGTQVTALNYTWRNIDAYTMYRYYYERSFIEIGPKMSFLNKMEEGLTNAKDVKANFTSQNLGAAFGFGGFLAGNENLSLGFNVRVDYQFSDFVNPTGKTGNYPLTFRTYSSYSATNPIIARIGLDLSFGLGGVAKAQCGRRVFFFGGGR